MGNPVIRGTMGARPFVSEHAEVIREDLFITIDERFKYANFNVKYYINSFKEGFQIPFLFYASEYSDSFSVRIDGKEVPVKEIPRIFRFSEKKEFQDFSYFFGLFDSTKNAGQGEIPLGKNFYITLDNMIYFEADIPKGRHLIEVSYKAKRWTDKSDWVRQYSFRYALSPAKYWKSFGKLSLTIDISNFRGKIKTNLDVPPKRESNARIEWEFNDLPVEILQISYVPEINKGAELLVKITPDVLAFIFGVFLIILHWITIYQYRKKNPEKKYSLPVILGSLVLPLVFIATWGFFYLLTDFMLGEHAGSRSYGIVMVFFALFYFYPLFTPFYWLVNWLMDKYFKRRLK